MSIDLNEFARALRYYRGGMSEDIALRYAMLYLNGLNPRLENALACWIKGEPIQDIAHGEFSIKSILNIRADHDELGAILLLSEYMQDPIAGKARILRPRR